jgi:hypothetical protein
MNARPSGSSGRRRETWGNDMRPLRGMQARKLAEGLIGLCLAFAVTTPAAAFRPFDGTDAAVADPGKMEVELQPAGRLHDDTGTTLIAPATRLNYGLTAGWEAVMEGLVETPLSPSGPSTLNAAGMFLKGVIRPGSLQDKAGPSIATEFGVLLPDSTIDSRFGASWAWIVSQRWGWGTVSLNAAAALTREQRGDIFLGAILEGPATWPVRPVAEFFYEREFGEFETFSGLIGLIWQVNEDLAFDVGVRHALTNARPVNELRAGVTFGFMLPGNRFAHH